MSVEVTEYASLKKSNFDHFWCEYIYIGNAHHGRKGVRVCSVISHLILIKHLKSFRYRHFRTLS